MLLRKWIGNRVDVIEGLSQIARRRDEWPYDQDWIVSRIAMDTVNRRYWIEGHHANGNPFYWGLYVDRPLDWRYDLTDTIHEVGRHETTQEAIERECHKETGR